MSQTRFHRIKRYGKQLFGSEKPEEIIHKIIQEQKAIDAKLVDRDFKVIFERLLRALVDERLLLINYNGSDPTSILGDFQKMIPIFNHFPTSGRHLLIGVIDIYNSRPKIREICELLITTLVTECPTISIPKESGHSNLKSIANPLLGELFVQFIDGRRIHLKYDAAARTENYHQLKRKVSECRFHRKLMKSAANYDEKAEIKCENDSLFGRNPFFLIFRDCLIRLKNDENGIGGLSKATIEIVCSFREIALAMQKGNVSEAVLLTLSAIKINGDSSISEKRASLLENLVKFFIPEHYTSVDLVACFYEIRNYFVDSFDSFQRFLSFNPRESHLYDLMTNPPKLTLSKQAFFGLHYGVKGAREILDSDPESLQLPGDSPSLG